MTVVGISMMWNEEDICEAVVRHMLNEVDEVIVADNNSTDRTREILEAIHDPHLHIEDEPSFGYYQIQTMNRLADEAREDYGASWVVPFDADEWWYSPSWPIRDVLPSINTFQVRAGEYVFVPQPTDADAPDPFARCVWRRDLVPDFKIAFRPASGRILGFGSHLLSDSDAWHEVATHTLYIRHLPYRSLDQAKRKLRHGKAALEAANQPRGVGWHWHEYGAWDDEAFSNWWTAWTAPKDLTRDPLPDPWIACSQCGPTRDPHHSALHRNLS
jgi:glycosyltransferase involved in cell wall biosynthesis